MLSVVYEKFVNMLIKIGHWSALSCGTVYLNVPRYEFDLIEKVLNKVPARQLASSL